MSTPILRTYAEASKDIDRRFMAVLSPSEFTVLRFILDRTLAHEREWAEIPVRHFLKQSPEDDADGNYLRPTLNLSQRTLIHCLKNLTKWELVRIEKAKPHHRRYACGLTITSDYQKD